MEISKWRKKVRSHQHEIYSKKADVYDKFTRFEDVGDKIPRYVSSNFPLKGSVVLELGCGTGRQTIPLAKKTKLVYALDNSPSMLKLLKRKLKTKRIKNVKPIRGDFGKIQLPSNSVDLVVSFWAFPFQSTKWKSDLKEITRVLKKGASLVFVVRDYIGEYARISRIVSKEADASSRDMHSSLLSMGFKRKRFNILMDFKNKKNIEKYLMPFFGDKMAMYLLVRDKVKISYGMAAFSKKN